MPITSHTYIVDTNAQPNGSHIVVARHTESPSGRVHQFVYYAANDLDVATREAARESELNEQLAAAEFDEVVGDGT